MNEDEINKLRQEEGMQISVFVSSSTSTGFFLRRVEKKIAALTSEQLMNMSRLDDVDEEDEEDLKTPEPEAVAVAITVGLVFVF